MLHTPMPRAVDVVGAGRDEADELQIGRRVELCFAQSQFVGHHDFALADTLDHTIRRRDAMEVEGDAGIDESIGADVPAAHRLKIEEHAAHTSEPQRKPAARLHYRPMAATWHCSETQTATTGVGRVPA